MNGTQAVVQAWHEACRALGVRSAPAAPLLRPDATVLFVNAGITPFKPAMLRGEQLRPAAVVQPCVRTHWHTPGRFAFDMLTMVGMAADVELAARLAADLVGRLGLARDSLRCVLDCGDADVAACAPILCELGAIEPQEGNDARYWTRWRFGEGEALVGRGLTLVHVDRDGRRLSLGNLIIIEHMASGQGYVDLGFGVERLASVPHDGDEWASTPAAAAIRRFIDRGASREYACDFVNRVTAMARIIGAGALPESRGAGYLLRKLVRSAIDAAATAAGSEFTEEKTIQKMLADLPVVSTDPKLTAIVHEEGIHYFAQLARSRQNLLKRARRTGAALASLDPAGTYGLPDWAVARMQAEQ